jgi:Mannosylglycerate hydrolase MGH1-like glycoside hydrolase domain
MPTEAATEQIRSLCEVTLRQNWREGVRQSDGVAFAYTCPSPRHYPWQWYWDSCFTAVVWRHFDAERARRELESLLAAELERGFIGHTIFWNTPLRDLRRFTYNVVTPGAPSTSTIQPPLLAWAWRIAVGDPTAEPRLAAHYDWLAAHRDLDGDGLIWIIQPDESGLDASPQFDPIWGHRTHGRAGFPLLVRRNRRLGFDLRRIVNAGGPVCCEVVTNVLYCLSLLALGRPSITPQLVERCYDERTGLFGPVVWPQHGRRIPVTWSALAPLALPDLPEAIGRRLVEEHLLDPQSFWLPVPPPSVSAREPAFSAREGLPGFKRYWRGPSWVNAAWLLWLGLIRLGYHDSARTMVERLASAVAGAGLREYYHPYTGRGMGAPSFAWSTLLLEMIDPAPAAAAAYLPR